MIRLVVLGLLAGCSSFEDPDVVLDLRVIAMTATVPEQVVEIDLANPQEPTELLGQLIETEVCALVADPGRDRRLRYQFTLCAHDGDPRCDPVVQVPLAGGLIEDPELAAVAPVMCTTIAPNGNLLGVLLATLEGDALRGLGGLDYLVQLTVRGEDEDPTLDQYAGKWLRVAPRIPAARAPNQNPTLDLIEARVDGSELAVPLPLGRCLDQVAPLEVPAGRRIKLTPIEPEGAREVYAVPTIDGRSQTFTESLRYRWISDAGSYTSGSTGGTRDVVGNLPPLFTEWRAPPASALDGPLDAQLWIIQRDERLGVQPYLGCVRVVP